MPKVVGAGCHQQRGFRVFDGWEGAFGGDPGQLRLINLGQCLRGDVVDLGEDTEGSAVVVSRQFTCCALRLADEPGEQQAGFFVVGGLVEAVRLVDVPLKMRQIPDWAIVARQSAQGRGDDFVVGECRSPSRDCSVLGAPVGRERERLSRQVLHRDSEDLSKPDDDRQSVDVANAALDLAHPGFGSADQIGQGNLGQATPAAVNGDALANRHVVHRLHHGAAPSVLAAGPVSGVPRGGHPVASCARLISSSISSQETIRASREADSSNNTRTPHSRSRRRFARNVG